MPAVPIRIVISSLVAVIVLIVAAVTLVITYSVSLETVRDLGSRYASSLVDNAKLSVERFFDRPVEHTKLVSNILKLENPGFNFPSEEPHDGNWRHKWVQNFRSYAWLCNGSYRPNVILLDDGSYFAFENYYEPTRQLLINHAGDIRGGIHLDRFWVNNMTEDKLGVSRAYYTMQPWVNSTFTDGRVGDYQLFKPLLLNAYPKGIWTAVTAFKDDVTSLEDTIIQITLGIAVYNASNVFLGIFAIAPSVEVVSELLLNVRPSDNAEVFMVLPQGNIVASTSKLPYRNARYINSALEAPGCPNNEGSRIRPSDPIVAVCLTRIQDHGFAPVAQATREHPDLLATQSKAQHTFSSDGETYYVVSTKVDNEFSNFQFIIVFIMPEREIIGNLVQGRNIAIGATVGIFVVALVLALVLVFFLLRPLAEVSKMMQQTAKLSANDDEDVEFSNLSEVRALQRSYVNMNMAIQSFTRYVPRDVVVDLMATGQLCAIEMKEMRCTMLFSDIAGFTTVCEHVPVGVLSVLISQYFDIMSKIVMKCDGIIDKFIGDCIMAVWGAPFATPNHEIKATLCAVCMDRETMIEPLRGAFDEAGEVLSIRTGVNTDLVLAGNMGSSERMNYTVIGDGVNLAARLESLNKQFGTRVMVSHDTAKQLGTVFELRLLLSIAVVGKAQPVQVYQVVGLAAPILSESDRHTIDENVKAMEATAMEQEREKQQQQDDLESRRSSVSTHAGAVYRIGKTRLPTLVLDAAQADDGSLVVSEVEKNFSRAASKAVRLYFSKQFSECLEALQRIYSEFPPELIGSHKPSTIDAISLKNTNAEESESSTTNTHHEMDHHTENSTTNTTNSKPSSSIPPARLKVISSAERSLEKLHDLCEAALLNPESFTGYLTANDK